MVVAITNGFLWSNPMSLADLLPTLHALPRAEKLQAIQVLASALLEEEKLLSMFPPGASYPISSPFGCYEAADQLRQLLQSK
jgi:hypothetical protein